MLLVKNLKCEYLDNPVGIDVLNPRLSWQIISDERNVVQRQFQIQVAIDKEFNNIVWNMHTYSDKSIHVIYSGAPLQSKKRYYYRLKVWTNTEKTIINRFFNEEGNLTSETQTAQVISLYFDLVPEEYKKKVAEKLVQLIEKKNMHLDTGFVGTPYICHVLTFAKASLDTMYGKLSVDWKVDDNKMTLKVGVPHNTSAVVILPGVEDKECVTKEYSDLEFSSETNNSLSLDVGSGEYTFIYDYIHV